MYKLLKKIGFSAVAGLIHMLFVVFSAACFGNLIITGEFIPIEYLLRIVLSSNITPIALMARSGFSVKIIVISGVKFG